jgi:hypothetical protein
MAVVFLVLVAVHHAPRAPTEIQHVLTVFLILMALGMFSRRGNRDLLER